jgi:hypothetical protein
MIVAGVNVFAILAAAVAGYAFGAAWYMSLSKPWMAAIGKTEADLAGHDGKGGSPMPFVIAFVANVVMAYVLTRVFAHLAPMSVGKGIGWAVALGAGFVVSTMAVNNAFGQRKAALTLIDSGHWLGVLAIQGAILGWFAG